MQSTIADIMRNSPEKTAPERPSPEGWKRDSMEIGGES
jgi:hypothetical protein